MVSFYDGATLMGTAPLVDGQATFSTSGLQTGDHRITAQADGSGMSSAMTQTVRSVVASSNLAARATSTSELPRTGGDEAGFLTLALLLLIGGLTVRVASRPRA